MEGGTRSYFAELFKSVLWKHRHIYTLGVFVLKWGKGAQGPT